MLFGEYSVTHEPPEEPLNGIGCFLIAACVQVVSEIVEVLFTPTRPL